MSGDSPRGPSRPVPGRPPPDPVQAQAWYRATFGDMPAPTANMDPASDPATGRERREACAVLERSIPKAYRWAWFDSPELPLRVGPVAARALDERIWKHRKLVFAGCAGAGKTSLAVACLRRWAASAGRVAAFVHAYELAVARLQHPAGHGEPELVERAMKLPLVLVDDIGSEREIAGNAVPDVIFLRHADDRALWVTTGLTRAQLVTRYGAGIVRRLLERARVIQVGLAQSR